MKYIKVMRKLILSLLSVCGIVSGCKTHKTVVVLEPEEFITAMQGDSMAVLLDVRRPSEYAEGHIKNAVNLDWLDSVRFNEGLLLIDKKHTYYIYCRSGRRSNAAAIRMQEAGYRVFDMNGGVLQWKTLGMPLVIE